MFRVPRPLMDLVREVPGIDHVFALTDDLHESDYDVDLDVSDLPRVLRIDARDFAAAVPYLGRSALLSRTLTRGRERRVRPCVGLAWRAGDWDVERNLPTHALQRLTSSGEARFQSLQFGASRLPPRTLDISCHDLRELARRMARLDLVIAVDSALAHLAGAMGLAVWTLLPANCDARWGQETEASPWYPTMKLFRQSSAGDWLGVIDRVIDELNKGAGLRFS